MDDLIKRLERWGKDKGLQNRFIGSRSARSDCAEAAAALVEAQATIARLETALRPFAQEHAWGPDDRFEIVLAGLYGSITGADLDRARAALTYTPRQFSGSAPRRLWPPDRPG